MNSKQLKKFRPIPGYEDKYLIDESGRIFCIGERKKFLKPKTRHDGYLVVGLCHNKKKYKSYRVHSLVMMTFVGVRPNKMTVNHIDNNKKNNSLKNLEYISHRENMKKAYRDGLIPPRKGELNGRSKFTEKIIRKIRSAKIKKGEQKLLAKKLKISPQYLSRIMTRKVWAHI